MKVGGHEVKLEWWSMTFVATLRIRSLELCRGCADKDAIRNCACCAARRVRERDAGHREASNWME